jgi:putative heme transporter
VPVVGSLIGGIPIVLLAALSANSVTAGAWVAAAFTLMHLLESKLLYPMVVGQRMKMHAVLVVASLLVGFEFFGILGMFFAPPLAAIARNVWVREQKRKREGTRELAPTTASAR